MLQVQGNKPSYTVDMWWPVNDEDNDWIQVGTWNNAGFDPLLALGKTHKELTAMIGDKQQGNPAWGLDHTPRAFRTEFAMVYNSFVPGLITVKDTKGGTKSYQDCVAYARSHNCRLPSVEEVRKMLEDQGNKPLYTVDKWWPVNDEDNDWIQVGTWTYDVFDPLLILGKTHKELTAMIGDKQPHNPGWGTDNHTPIAFRTEFAMVSTVPHI